MANTQNLGVVRPVPRGNWLQDTNYEYLNIVFHQNASYIAIQSNTNIVPGITSGWQLYWQVLALGIDQDAQMQIDKNSMDIKNIQTVLQGNSQYALITLSQAYISRITANGANIFDGQLTPVESIRGSTVRYNDMLKNANINSIVSTGKNLFNKAAAEKVSNWDFSQVYQKFKLFTFKKEKTYTISIAEMNAHRDKNTDISGYDFILTVSPTSGVGSGTQILGSASSTYYDGTNKIYRISANDTTDKYLWIYMPNSSFYNDEWLEYVFTNIVKGMMILEGTQEIPYEPYIEHKYQLPQTVELAEFDIINPPEQTLTRYTATKVFEITQGVWAMPTEGLFRYEVGISNADFSQPAGQGVCNLFDFNAEQSGLTNTWYFKDGELYFVKNDITTLNGWSAFLATQSTNGNPLMLAYKTATPVSTTIFAAPQSYEVYKGGMETIVQGTTDNSEYGAMPTITQTYLGKVGS